MNAKSQKLTKERDSNDKTIVKTTVNCARNCLLEC